MSPADDLNNLLSDSSHEVKQLTLAVQHLILSIVPEADEKIYLGWRVIQYSLDGSMQTAFVSVGPQAEYVNIYFANGAHMKDPDKLLEGVGKNIRHIKIRDLKQLKNSALKKLIKASVGFTK